MLHLLYRQLLLACSFLFCFEETCNILSSDAMLVYSVCWLKFILWEKIKRLKSLFLWRSNQCTFHEHTKVNWAQFWRLIICHQSMKFLLCGLHHSFCYFLNKSFVLFTLEFRLIFKISSSWFKFKPCSVKSVCTLLTQFQPNFTSETLYTLDHFNLVVLNYAQCFPHQVCYILIWVWIILIYTYYSI